MPRLYDKEIVREYEGFERNLKKAGRERENQERGEGRDAVAQWVLLQGISHRVAMTTDTRKGQADHL